MGNTAAYAYLTQALQHTILRATHMQDDRQIVTASQLELRQQQGLLSLRVQIRHIKIQPALPHGHRLSPREILLQQQQVIITVTGQEQGVQTQRYIQPQSPPYRQ